MYIKTIVCLPTSDCTSVKRMILCGPRESQLIREDEGLTQRDLLLLSCFPAVVIQCSHAFVLWQTQVSDICFLLSRKAFG